MLLTNEVVNKYAALSAWRDVCLIIVLVVVCLVEGQHQTVTDCVQLPVAAACAARAAFIYDAHVHTGWTYPDLVDAEPACLRSSHSSSHLVFTLFALFLTFHFRWLPSAPLSSSMSISLSLVLPPLFPVW